MEIKMIYRERTLINDVNVDRYPYNTALLSNMDREKMRQLREAAAA
jgi:hypothetical protein